MGNTNEQTLGKRIAEGRKKKGYTQEEFSSMLDVTAQAVSKWENDISCPDIMLLPKIAEILNLTTDELLTGKKPEHCESQDTQAPATTVAKSYDRLFLRIKILAPGKKPINIRLPIALVKGLAKAGKSIHAIVDVPESGKESRIGSIEFEQIMDLIVSGAKGEIINITDEDGTNIIVEIS